MADLADTKVQHLLSLTLEAMRVRGLSIPCELTSSSSVRHDMYNNTCFTQIACIGLTQKYDGSPDNLIPTLNLTHIRHLNEVWGAATYFTQNGV
jgi:hypothetical protein